MKFIVIVVLIIAAAGAYFLWPEPQTTNMPEQTFQLKLTSPAFANMGKIPEKYACDGGRVSPPLNISGVTLEAKSLVLIMEDPDVPKSVRPDGMWDHWLKFNLPPTLTNIGEGQDPGGVAGITTSKGLSYVPPCPPDREHRYFFKLFSLDTILDLNQGASKPEIEAAMQGHTLQQAELVGLYEKK